MIPLNHSGTAAQTTLTTAIDETITTIPVVPPPANSWPDATFVVTVDRGFPSEEKMLVTWVSSDRTSLTVERGFDGTAGVAHERDAVIEHTISAAEMQWLSDHLNSPIGHRTTSAIVGVDDPQVLRNKVIDDVNNDISITTNSILNYQQILAARDVNFVRRHQPMGAETRAPNEAGVPTGTVVLWAGISPRPIGWLLCDGALYAQIDYPELYLVLGGQFTPTPNPDTFAVPDLRGWGPTGLNYYIFDGIGGP